nr:hypothetical protein [Tanacetum cinerariifolium]
MVEIGRKRSKSNENERNQSKPVEHERNLSKSLWVVSVVIDLEVVVVGRLNARLPENHVGEKQLALMCSRMFLEEINKVEKYIGGLPDMILGSVKASRSKTMQEVIEFTTELMEDTTRAYAECQADNKKKSEDIARNNQNQQPYKRQNTGQAYTAGNGNRRLYARSRPICPKCNYNHKGPCPPKCNNCKRVGHLTKDC